MKSIVKIILFFLATSLSYGQSNDSIISEIRRNYQQVQEFLKKDYIRTFRIDDSGEGGVKYFDFFSNGRRLFYIEEVGGYEEGEEFEVEYYFDINNNISFIYLKYRFHNFHGGKGKYEEERIYISDDKIVLHLEKRFEHEDPSEVSHFEENIDTIQNKEIKIDQYNRYLSKAVKLSKIWSLKYGI